MNNEFYCVDIYWGQRYYFRSKDAAFECLWQIYLDNYGNDSKEVLVEIKQELYEFYKIDSFGEVQVCGFED